MALFWNGSEYQNVVVNGETFDNVFVNGIQVIGGTTPPPAGIYDYDYGLDNIYLPPDAENYAYLTWDDTYTVSADGSKWTVSGNTYYDHGVGLGNTHFWSNFNFDVSFDLVTNGAPTLKFSATDDPLSDGSHTFSNVPGVNTGGQKDGMFAILTGSEADYDIGWEVSNISVRLLDNHGYEWDESNDRYADLNVGDNYSNGTVTYADGILTIESDSPADDQAWFEMELNDDGTGSDVIVIMECLQYDYTVGPIAASDIGFPFPNQVGKTMLVGMGGPNDNWNCFAKGEGTASFRVHLYTITSAPPEIQPIGGNNGN